MILQVEVGPHALVLDASTVGAPVLVASLASPTPLQLGERLKLRHNAADHLYEVVAVTPMPQGRIARLKRVRRGGEVEPA